MNVDRAMHRLTLLLAFLVVCMWMFACLEAIQTVEPTSVDVQVEVPGATTGVDTGSDTGNGSDIDGEFRMQLEPPVATWDQGTSAVVKVVVFDVNGQEIPTESISVTIDDTAIAALKDIDGRFVLFSGVGVGDTQAIITAFSSQYSLQAVLEITVRPGV